MGTSKSYQAPTTPQWGKLKGDITQLSADGAVPSDVARGILGEYIRTNGGASGISRGGGVIGGSRAAQSTARKLAGFLSSVAARGLNETLENLGLDHLIGQSAIEISNQLIDNFCEDGSTLDDVDVRNALSDLNRELFQDTLTYEDLKNQLEVNIYKEELENLLVRFFGLYIYHQFCRAFYERLVTRNGNTNTSEFMNSIKRCVESDLRLKTFGRDISHIDWKGDEGKMIIDDIMQDTLFVFGA